VKVLTATSRTQGQRCNDFNWLTDGELVCLGMRCDGAKVDDKCGCARSWTGMATRKAGTTAEVTESALTVEEYRAALTVSMDGWMMTPDEINAMAAELLDVASHFPVGAVVEHRGQSVQARRPAPART